jgi:hypothetical protein
VEASGYRGVEIDACRAWRIAGYALFAALSDALNPPFVQDGSGSTPVPSGKSAVIKPQQAAPGQLLPVTVPKWLL